MPSSEASQLKCPPHLSRLVRDCNPGLEFSIPGFGIVKFPIPGSRRDWRSIVKTTKIATWVTVFGSIFELKVYDRAMHLVLMCCNAYRIMYYYNYYSANADMASTIRGQIIATSDLSKSRKIKGHLANRQIKIHMRRHEGSKFQQTVVSV